jgi:hypothetical protein
VLRKSLQTKSYTKAIEMVSDRIVELSPKSTEPMDILRTILNSYTIIQYSQVKERLSSYSFQENMNYLLSLGYVKKVGNGYQLVKQIPDDLESVTKPNNNRAKSQKLTFYHRMRNQIITKFNSSLKDGSIFFLKTFLEGMFTKQELTHTNKKDIELFLLNLREDGYISQNGYGGLKAIKEIPVNYCSHSLPSRKTDLPIGFDQLRNL